MTSEIDKSDEEIIACYHGLSRIEDAFRITKTDLAGRPVSVRPPGHINAHLLICFTALTMIRLIQHKIIISQGKTISHPPPFYTSRAHSRRISSSCARLCASNTRPRTSAAPRVSFTYHATCLRMAATA